MSLLGIVSFVMTQKMLREIKACAERPPDQCMVAESVQ
jgi:hypothetical protein